MTAAPEFLIVALSGRALAAAARHAGHRVAVIDLFGDVDTQRLAETVARVPGDPTRGFDADALMRAMARFPSLPLIPGTGFERDPVLLQRIARGRRLLGTPPAVLRTLKHPLRFARLLARLGVPHPETRRDAPDNPREWLVKRAGASGGAHIVPASTRSPAPGSYFQRRVDGMPVSVAFVADGRRARAIDISAQWQAPTRQAPFRYGGAVAPAVVSRAIMRLMIDATETVAAESGAVGLGSADFLVADDGGFVLLEINPRPGSTLDILDRRDPPRRASAFALHLAACDGRLPRARPLNAGPAMAAAVVYAARNARVPAGMRWPAATADLTAAGTILHRDDPVCTVIARAATAAPARAAAERKALAVLARLDYA